MCRRRREKTSHVLIFRETQKIIEKRIATDLPKQIKKNVLN